MIGLDIKPAFTWPSTGRDGMAGLYFHGVLVNPDHTGFLGMHDSVMRGYSGA